MPFHVMPDSYVTETVTFVAHILYYCISHIYFSMKLKTLNALFIPSFATLIFLIATVDIVKMFEMNRM